MGRAPFSKEANKKSRKLSPFVKMAKTGGEPVQWRSERFFGNCLLSCIYAVYIEIFYNLLLNANKQVQSPRTVPFFLLVSLLDGYSFTNVLVKGIVAFEYRPLKHEPIKDMFILSIGMATSLISLCFSIIGIRSRSQLLLEENFFHCSGLLIFRLNLT